MAKQKCLECSEWGQQGLLRTAASPLPSAAELGSTLAPPAAALGGARARPVDVGEQQAQDHDDGALTAPTSSWGAEELRSDGVRRPLPAQHPGAPNRPTSHGCCLHGEVLEPHYGPTLISRPPAPCMAQPGPWDVGVLSPPHQERASWAPEPAGRRQHWVGASLTEAEP